MAKTTTNKITTISTTAKTMLKYAILIAVIAYLTLSVDAIRCHQCNSHTHADCAHLIVNTPRGQRDNQFLAECEGENDAEAFCRKTVISFDVNDEKHIERSCGWVKENTQNVCFNADNEGYQQVICTCSGDGCNGAQLPGINHLAVFTVTGISLAVSALLRR